MIVIAIELSTSAKVWEFVTHYWAALVIAATCLSLLTFAILLLTKYVRICLNIFTDTPLPLSIGSRDFQIIQGEEVRFRSFDGTSLRGMWLPAPKRLAYKGTIVFCHEFGSDMYSCARYTRPLIEVGFDVFTFDFRGHGDSSSPRNYRPLQWPSDRELEDVLGACAYVEEALSAAGRAPRIGVFGISRGAAAGILAASSDRNIAAILCDGAFSTAETLVTLMKRWASIFGRVKLVYQNHPDAFWRFLLWLMMRFAQPRLSRRFLSVRKALENMIARPIMFIHGKKDSYIRSDQAELLYRAAAEPKYLWIVPNAKHNQSVTTAPDQYAARTTAFFGKYLADETVSEAELTGEAAEPNMSKVAQ
jgi:alpha-beta hydrolase superfamily lysophospholipase